MISSEVKEHFRDTVRTLHHQAKNLLTDMDTDSLEPESQVAALVKHYFLLLKLSAFDQPIGYRFDNFVDRRTGLEGSDGRRTMQEYQTNLEKILKRLCKIHDIDFDGIKARIDDSWSYFMALQDGRIAPLTDLGLNPQLNPKNIVRPSSRFADENDPSRDL